MARMVSVQIRLPSNEVNRIDSYVEGGEFSSRSDFIRDAVRKAEMLKSLMEINDILGKAGITFEDLHEGGGEISRSLFGEMFGGVD